jgi:hypothetical protein
VLIAVAGRSNGLGPVLSGHTCFPVINCPPVRPENVTQDIWSSLNIPSGEHHYSTRFAMQLICIQSVLGLSFFGDSNYSDWFSHGFSSQQMLEKLFRICDT